ncbi:UNVERIFIED_ORG: RND family efflux transporter MFP subunit [Paraburkholderia sediminicola]|nr:RND family efflux transporter MFP subunit [Paraburkholderia sediminicola]
MSQPTTQFFRRKRVALQIITLAVVAGSGLLLKTHASASSDSVNATPAPQVTVVQARTFQVDDRQVFTGRLQAVDTIDVRPRVSGYVDEVLFKEGARVHKGDVLFRIDPRPYRAEVDRLTAELAQAQAEAAQARSNSERGRRLLTQSAISQEASEQLDTAASTSRSKALATRAQLDAAQLNLSFTEVRAPIDGKVSYAMITAGNLVTPDAVLTRVVSLDPIYGYFDVDEQSYLTLQHFRDDGHSVPEVAMALADEHDFTHVGHLDFVDNQLDSGSGTIRLRAVFANAQGAYTPGLYAQIRLQETHPVPRILMRDTAVGTDLGNQFVYVVGPDSKIIYRKVSTGPVFAGLRVVESGIQPGERVVVDGLQHVQPGMVVQPVTVSMDTDLNERQKAELANVAKPVSASGATALAAR